MCIFAWQPSQRGGGTLGRVPVLYTGGMRSVADQLRADARAATAARTFEERLHGAFALAERDAGLLAEVRGIGLREARCALARQRQRGRLRSACHESLFR
jgi:hypothetical protein